MRRHKLLFGVLALGITHLLFLPCVNAQGRVKTCVGVDVRSVTETFQIMRSMGMDPKPDTINVVSNGPEGKVTVVAFGPLLGPMDDSTDVKTDLACTQNGLELTAMITRSANFHGAIAQNVIWVPRITIVLALRQPEIAVQAIWRMRLTTGAEQTHAQTPPFPDRAYPITVTETVRSASAPVANGQDFPVKVEIKPAQTAVKNNEAFSVNTFAKADARPSASRPRRKNIQENGEVVRDAASQHKQVPGGVEVAQPVVGEEENAQRVSHAARAQPHYSVPADGALERRHRDHDHPALRQINQRRCPLEAVHGKALEDYAGHGQRPLEAKERPAERPAQRDQREGRVSARDQQIDGRVIQNVKDVARPRPHQRVVERGAEINQHQRRRKDRATDYVPCRAAGGGGDQVDRAHNRQRRADAMRDGVGQNIAQLVFRLHSLMIARRGINGAFSDQSECERIASGCSMQWRWGRVALN